MAYPYTTMTITETPKHGAPLWLIAIICIILVFVFYYLYSWFTNEPVTEGNNEIGISTDGIDTLKNNWSYLRDNNSDLCLTSTIENQVVYATCRNDDNLQLWKLNENGQLMSQKSTTKCLNPMTDGANGASVTIGNCDTGYWTAEHYPNNIQKFRLTDTRAGTCLDQLQKTPITGIMNNCNGDMSQYFTASPSGN
jgi:hypothetical protein